MSINIIYRHGMTLVAALEAAIGISILVVAGAVYHGKNANGEDT